MSRELHRSSRADRFSPVLARTLGRRVCRVVMILALVISAHESVLAQINLSVSHGATPGQVVLIWSGGSPSYNLYIGDSADLSGGGVEALLMNSTSTSYTSSAAGDLIFFSVGDSTAPQVTITSPVSSVTAGHISVFGNTNVPAASVWVNRRQSQISGTSFTANDVLLVLGDNTLHAAAVAPDGNIYIASSQVTRIPGNDPPMLSILSPLEGSQVWDVTPLVQVSYSDTTALDPAKFRAYLDGTDQTSKFTVTPTGASWQVTEADALGIGTHILRVTMQDADFFTQGVSSQFRVSGPRLDSITPSKATPNTTVTIAGEGFGTTLDTQVFFNALQATTIISVSPTQIQVRVPAGTTDGPLTVQVSGVASNSLPFDVTFASAGGPSNYVAIDAQDRVYYASTSSVTRINQDGSGLTTIFSTADEISGIAFDPVGTTLYINTRGAPFYTGTQYIYETGRIYSVAPNGVTTLRFVLDPFSSPRFSDPSGLDVKPPFVYVGATQPDISESVLQLNLNNPASRAVLINFALSDWLIGDVKLDSSNNIYTVYSAAGAFAPAIYKNSGFIYQLGSPGPMTVDCLDRVIFTDDPAGQVRRLVGFQSSVLLATTGGSPYGVDLDSKGNVFVATNSSVFRAMGAAATISSCSSDFPTSITGDSPKVFADYDPTSGTETPNSQFVVLTACLGDSSVPRAATDRVYWTYEDVDDPASDTNLDPTPAGNDNLGDLDGSPEFTQEGSFTLTVGAPGQFQYGTAYGTVGSSICSRVRFHPTDAPGDNFTATALLRTKVGDRSSTTKTMTIWKRVHVELDSMGETQGIIDADDAVMGDVPDPEPDFLISAFAPAYIEVIIDGPGPTTDVAFDQHVPDHFTSLDDPLFVNELEAQGGLGREPANVSSSGSWRMYAQGTYEGPDNRDGDPDSEQAFLGLSIASGRYSLVNIETIRDFAEGLSQNESYLRAAIPLHELAHQFGVHDDDTSSGGLGGVMETQSTWSFPYFNAIQLRIIREVGRSNGYPSQ